MFLLVIMAYYNSLEKLGAAFLICSLFYVVKFIWNVIWTFAVGPAVNKLDFKSKGKWALITGATDGIGKQYARELASKGCDIVLVSRSVDKLKTTAEEIEKDFKVSTKIVQADFTSDEDIYERISREISGLEIGTLVNNVGISYLYPEYFLDVPDWETTMSNLVKANIVSVTRMTKLIMPGMVERKKGVVINIGSGASTIPSPLLTVYSASKAYVDKFSEGLEMEYAKKGIIVQCILPGFVCSNMSGLRKSTLLAPTAEVFVKSALSQVGILSRTTGYLPHTIFHSIINTVQSASESVGTWLVIRSMENTRQKWLRKYKKQ